MRGARRLRQEVSLPRMEPDPKAEAAPAAVLALRPEAQAPTEGRAGTAACQNRYSRVTAPFGENDAGPDDRDRAARVCRFPGLHRHGHCVIQTGGETISILPAEPQVICVPVYSPQTTQIRVTLCRRMGPQPEPPQQQS